MTTSLMKKHDERFEKMRFQAKRKCLQSQSQGWFKVKDEGDFVSEEESRFINSRWYYIQYYHFPGKNVSRKTLWVCVELTYFTNYRHLKCQWLSTVKNKGFAEEELSWWRKMNLTTWKRWHTGTVTTFTFTTTGLNDWTDLQIDQRLFLIGMLIARSGIEDLEGLKDNFRQ